MWRDHKGADEGGFVTAEWMAGIALLVLPVLVVIAALPGWAARHEAAAVAAREGARVAALAATVDQARGDARGTVTRVLAGRGFDGPVSVRVDGPAGTGTLPREGSITVTVSLQTPGIDVPFIGHVEGPSVTAIHARRLDPYRSR